MFGIVCGIWGLSPKFPLFSSLGEGRGVDIPPTGWVSGEARPLFIKILIF